jgi:hypothetical protein
MKRFKAQQIYFALIMLILGVLLIAGCGSDEAELLKGTIDHVRPGTCHEAGPKVISSDPINNAENVPKIGTLITVTFDEAMDPTTIVYTNQGDPQAETFKLRDNNDLAFTEGTVAMDVTNTIATFTPTAALHGDSWYTVTITKYAKRLSDNSELGCSYQWEFKTAAP